MYHVYQLLCCTGKPKGKTHWRGPLKRNRPTCLCPGLGASGLFHLGTIAAMLPQVSRTSRTRARVARFAQLFSWWFGLGSFPFIFCKNQGFKSPNHKSEPPIRSDLHNLLSTRPSWYLHQTASALASPTICIPTQGVRAKSAHFRLLTPSHYNVCHLTENLAIAKKHTPKTMQGISKSGRPYLWL